MRVQIEGDLEFCLGDITAVKKSIKNAQRRRKQLVEFRKASAPSQSPTNVVQTTLAGPLVSQLFPPDCALSVRPRHSSEQANKRPTC